MRSSPTFRCRVGTAQTRARRGLRVHAGASALAFCLAGCGGTATPAGPALHTDPRDENHAGAQYGTLASVSVAQEYVSDDTASGEPELFSANNLLATQFGLGAVCAEGSYRGTLPKHPDYPGPGVTEKPLRKSVWLSCRMMYDIGENEQAGQAVGWTSKKTAWLVIAPDDGTARSLVTALQNRLEQ